MTSRDQIMQRLASAQRFDEQIQLVAELDALDAAAAKTAQAERSLDWADTVVRETLAPGRTLDRHTASSDWLAVADTDPGEDHHHKVIAEASVWFQRLDPDVKADAHEFVEQARGIARRTAGKYGEQAEAAADAFLQYVAFLNRQVLAASGLPQIQQRVDSFENEAPTPLPTDVFPNFAPPVHPVNEGVEGTQTNSLAPGAEEAMAESQDEPVAGRPSQHDDFQAPVGQPYYLPPSARQGSHKHAGALERAKDQTARKGHNMIWSAATGPNDPHTGRCAGCGESIHVTTAGITDGSTAHAVPCRNRSHGSLVGPPSVAIGYEMNMDDFLRAEAAAQARRRTERPRAGGAPFSRQAERTGGDDDGSMPGGDLNLPNDGRHDGDGGKDEDTTKNTRRKEAASGLDQIQQTTAPDGVSARPTSLPLGTMFPIVQPWDEEEADYSGGGQGGESQGGSEVSGRPSAHNAEPAVPLAAPLPGTPRQAMRRQADTWSGGDVPKAVPGGETPVANSPATTPPSSNDGNFQQGVQRGQADAAAGQRPSFADNSSAVSDFVRGYVEGYGGGQPAANPQDVPRSMGGDSGQAVNFARIERQREKPLLNVAAKGMTVSASLVSKDVSADADFQRGYHYGRSWKPGRQLVAMGSQGEEAGIYAGITDNPGYQKAWVAAHRKHGRRYPELNARLREHRRVTASLCKRNEDLIVRGLYVQAATSLDLDTMSPVTTPDPQGATPSEGPGSEPPLLNAPGTPAAPGGPAPYNGAEPFGQPVVPDPMIPEPEEGGIPMVREQGEVHLEGDSSLLSKNPTAMAFRQRVQANKLALRQRKGN